MAILDLISFKGPPQHLAIYGGKGVGKSTLSCWSVNRILEFVPEVLYIDLDPGQAEFTPPGLISLVLVTEPLVGPNFTHLKQPLE
jgi:polynucleotide 5'-hydroxyl-kinase GRC3/NOL9